MLVIILTYNEIVGGVVLVDSLRRSLRRHVQEYLLVCSLAIRFRSVGKSGWDIWRELVGCDDFDVESHSPVRTDLHPRCAFISVAELSTSFVLHSCRYLPLEL